jgi:hypothetical protein
VRRAIPVKKQAKIARRFLFQNHVKMFKMNENLAAKRVKGGCPPPAWSLAPKVPYFYTETPHCRTAAGCLGKK